MTKNKLLFAVATLAIAAAAVTGCKAKPAIAPRSDVQASSEGNHLRVARAWPKSNIHIGPGGNKFFLWKLKTVEECPGRANLPFPGMNNPGGPTRPKLGPCPDDVAFVLNMSNRPGNGLIALDDKTFLIQKEYDALIADVAALNLHNSAGALLGLEDLINLIDKELPRVPEYTRKLDAAVQQRAPLLEQRTPKAEQLAAEQNKPTAEQDANLIAQLTSEIAALDARIKPIQKQIDKYTAAINDANNAPQQVADNQLEGVIETFRKDVKQKAEISAESELHLNEVKATVDFYNYSDQLTTDFTFNDDGSISVSLVDWDFRFPGPGDTPIGEEGNHTFSTSDGTITNVTYVEMPGTFEFDVHAPDARFHFKLSRTRYAANDGKVHLQGDILRYSADGSDRLNPRRGVAVMDEPSATASANAR